jgi:hypothetical protein
MDIPYVDMLQTLSFSYFFAMQGMGLGRPRQVLKVELRIKGQKVIWYLGVQLRDKARNGPNFVFIYISWDE